MEPAGKLVFVAWMARITSSTPMPWALSSIGFMLMRIWRARKPRSLTCPTPATPWKRLLMTCSVMVDSERRSCPVEVSTMVAMGRSLSPSARAMNGSLASFGKRGRTRATLSRKSCMALSMLVDSSNSRYTPARPSHELARMVLMPLTVLTASSMGRVMSFSTASGEAPG